MPAVDRNTGQPATTQPNQSFTQTQQTGPSTTETNSTGTQVTQGSQYVQGSSYNLNTTPEAREALNNLIQQLSDRPVIDQAQATAKFPMAMATYTANAGWVYVNPVTKLNMSATEAQNFNSIQQAKQQEFIQSGGMVAGGTVEQRATETARQEEITRNRDMQGDYSKDAAFADTKALTDYFSRVLSEQQMPGILRGAEGAGASAGTTRALLSQQAIQRSSESAAKVGIEAAGVYGGISTQLAGVLEQLTRGDPNGVTAQLLQALNISKGIETSGNTSQRTDTNQTVNTKQNQVANKTGEEANIFRDYGNTNPVANVGVTAAVPSAYTPSANAGNGYIVANSKEPYSDASFIVYGGNDSNTIIN